MNGCDTDLATRDRQLELYRSLSREQRLERTLALTGLLWDMLRQDLRRRHPTLGAGELADRFLRQVYGAELANRVGPQLSSVARK